MHNYYPILWVGAIIGVISTLLIVAAFVVKDGEKETGFERNMKDSEIMQRLMDYAKPFYRQFIVVGFLMLFSIAYDIISPLIVGKIEELVVGKFALNTLFLWVAGYAAILLVSMACTYFQAVILQIDHLAVRRAGPVQILVFSDCMDFSVLDEHDLVHLLHR